MIKQYAKFCLSSCSSHEIFTVSSAIPGVIFSILHNISGAILADIWSKQEEL